MDAVSPIIGSQAFYNQVVPAANAASSSEAKAEFMTIFYKELLKQAFRAPSFGLDGNEESQDNDFFSSFSTDTMVEQLAQEFAKQGMTSAQWQMLGKGIK